MADAEYGVRLPDGTVQLVYYDADTASVMSYEQYAHTRAAQLGGSVVSRTSEVVYSEWEPAPTELDDLRARVIREVQEVRSLAKDDQYLGAQLLADLVEEYLEAQGG